MVSQAGCENKFCRPILTAPAALVYKSPMLTSVQEIIDVFGNQATVAGLAGVKPNAVSNWNVDNAIPPRYFLIFLEELKKHKKTPDPALFGFAETGAFQSPTNGHRAARR